MTIALWVLEAVLLAPALIFCIECWAAMLPGTGRKMPGALRPRVAVLIPAHNEEPVLAQTLASLLPQLGRADSVLVVADNCEDTTADVARAAGVRVLERRDTQNLGKGYALSAGLASLEPDSFDVLLVLDADCLIEPGSLDALAEQVAASNAPSQAIYVMERSEPATPRDRVSAWAFVVKNLVRPMGLSRLGLPCQLTGTGMAFPRAALTNIKLATPNIVEDMQLGLDLALNGYAPRLCPAVRVTGKLPRGGDAALTQRRRWEHGHLRTIFTQAPRMFLLGMARMKPGAIAMAIDLLVPPLSLLLVLMILATGLAAAAVTLGASRWPAITLAGALAVLIFTVFVAWLRFGRSYLPAGSLLAVAGYVLWKIPMYAMFIVRPEKKWVRTERADHLPDSAKTAA